jgi:hypothetical protein
MVFVTHAASEHEGCLHPKKNNTNAIKMCCVLCMLCDRLVLVRTVLLTHKIQNLQKDGFVLSQNTKSISALCLLAFIPDSSYADV